MKQVPTHLAKLDAISKELLKEEAALEALYERIRSLPAGDAELDAYAERLAMHGRRAIEFAQTVRRLLNAPFN